MSAATIDRRVYSPISDSAASSGGASGDASGGASGGAAGGSSWGPAGVLMAVSMSVPDAAVDDMTAWYDEEHIPLLLAVPGWRRSRRFVLAEGAGPRYLSLHEIESRAAFDEPAYKAAVSTPWRDRVVSSALARERRVFERYASWA